MTDQTRDLLKRLSELDWFHNCGTRIDSNQVTQIGSWKEAAKLCLNKDNENACIESRNILMASILSTVKERYKNYTKLWAEVTPFVLSILATNVKKNGRKLRISKKVESAVWIHLIHACMESEFADAVPPRFFTERATWYLAGHFPCAWDGSFPEGKLIVY